MVNRAEALYRLQKIDTDLNGSRDALSRVEGQLAQNGELLAARRKLTEAEDRLQTLRGKLRNMELDLEGILSKIFSAQEMLYGGEITSPKELASLEQEIEYLRRQQSEVEDRTLETMAEVEEKESRLQMEEEGLRRREREWKGIQEDLGQQVQELRSHLASLEGERKEILLTVSEHDIAVYEELRDLRRGEAVALIEGGICQGCRVALPTSLVQKVRRGQDLVSCSSCGRILYSLS